MSGSGESPAAAAVAKARPYLYWEHEVVWKARRQQAVLEVSTQLKLIRVKDGDSAVKTRLYDLRADPGEGRDLAAERAGDVARLSAAARGETVSPGVGHFFDAGAVFGG